MTQSTRGAGATRRTARLFVLGTVLAGAASFVAPLAGLWPAGGMVDVAAAQTPPASPGDSLRVAPPAPPTLPLPPEVQMTDIIAIPSASDARLMKEAAEAEEKTLQMDVQASREREARYRTKIDIRKGEVQSTKGRLELAKKEKNQPLQKELEATKARQEAEVSLYERMMELERTQAELVELRRVGAQSVRKAADAYGALSEKWKSRGEMLAMGSAAEKLVQAERQVRDAEKKALEAMKDAANRKSDIMNKEKDMVDRRMAAFQALTKVLAL